jgi:methyl-accepting chemotaxis protein
VTQRIVRQPFKHFFIKKSIQYKIIAEIVFVIASTALLTTATLTFLYNVKAKNGTFYYMSNDTKQDLELKGVLELILPSVVGAQVFSILIGLGIGLFSSRKIAVPIYKFEKWVMQLKNGNLNTKISFRENEEMKDLTVECNALAEYYKNAFLQIEDCLKILEKEPHNPQAAEQIQKLGQLLEKINYR